MVHTQGASLGGQTAAKGAYSKEFHTELRQSDRAYKGHTKGISYTLNLSVKLPLTIIYSP